MTVRKGLCKSKEYFENSSKLSLSIEHFCEETHVCNYLILKAVSSSEILMGHYNHTFYHLMLQSWYQKKTKLLSH